MYTRSTYLHCGGVFRIFPLGRKILWNITRGTNRINSIITPLVVRKQIYCSNINGIYAWREAKEAIEII